MHEIPHPEVLNAERTGSHERDTMSGDQGAQLAERLKAELRETCEYAQALWDELEKVRRYLVSSLPAPSKSGDAAIGGARPTGRDDEWGWRAWTDVYAGVVGALAGPRGDSGFGMDEARQIVRARLEFPADQQPTMETIERR